MNADDPIYHTFAPATPPLQILVLEDALYVYREIRPPERKVFYVDTTKLTDVRDADADEPAEYLPNKFKKPVIELEAQEDPKPKWQAEAEKQGWEPPAVALRGLATFDAPVDLPPQHGLDVEQELSSALTAAINEELIIQPDPLQDIKDWITNANKSYLFDEIPSLNVMPGKPIPFVHINSDDSLTEVPSHKHEHPEPLDVGIFNTDITGEESYEDWLERTGIERAPRHPKPMDKTMIDAAALLDRCLVELSDSSFEYDAFHGSWSMVSLIPPATIETTTGPTIETAPEPTLKARTPFKDMVEMLRSIFNEEDAKSTERPVPLDLNLPPVKHEGLLFRDHHEIMNRLITEHSYPKREE